MQVINAELLRDTCETVKFILNDTVIVFLPVTRQHRDIKTHGLSYEDDYRGNAVAGLVIPARVEIRFHKAFSDDRIRTIWARLRAMSELSEIGLAKVYYQGREIF